MKFPFGHPRPDVLIKEQYLAPSASNLSETETVPQDNMTIKR